VGRLCGYGLVGVALAFAGCGGGSPASPAATAAQATTAAVSTASAPPTVKADDNSLTITTAATTPPPTTTAAPAPRSDDCQALGMTRARMREGPCTHGGLALYVANRGTDVRLREMSVKLNGFGIEPAESGHVLAVFSLTVTSHLHRRAAFDPGSDATVLNIGSHRFVEDRKVENAPSVSFAWKNAGIPPGGTQTGTVTFHISRGLVAQLSRTANLVVTQFSDEGLDTPRRRVAILRTYR